LDAAVWAGAAAAAGGTMASPGERKFITMLLFHKVSLHLHHLQFSYFQSYLQQLSAILCIENPVAHLWRS